MDNDMYVFMMGVSLLTIYLCALLAAAMMPKEEEIERPIVEVYRGTRS